MPSSTHLRQQWHQSIVFCDVFSVKSICRNRTRWRISTLHLWKLDSTWRHWESCTSECWEFLPEAIAELLPFSEGSREIRTRLLVARHDRQCLDPIRGHQTQIFKRSVFGYVAICNRPPQHVVEAKTVKCFKKQLQDAMRHNLCRGTADW